MPALASCATPHFGTVHDVIRAAVDAHEISGAVTAIVTREGVVHCEAVGMADVAKGQAMEPDTIFWIASMTKPVTAVALLMLQDEGKLNVADPIAKYIPDFAGLRTPSGKPANLTIAQAMTHTSGLGEADRKSITNAHSLADLIPLYLAVPMQYEPGTQWRYTQSGINTAARIVEIASGLPFDAFLEQRLFNPLGMKHTTFYPSRKPSARLAVGYRFDRTIAELRPTPLPGGYRDEGRPPLGNGGLFSTGPDYARFCQMLLGEGVLGGKRYLSADAMRLLTTVQTGDMPTGFFQSPGPENRGTNYGWGIGTCVLRAPHPGVAAMLSPGTFGHGGAWGTQAWVDPVRGVAYILMIQRSDIGNSDGSELRRAFQQAASDALPVRR